MHPSRQECVGRHEWPQMFLSWQATCWKCVGKHEWTGWTRDTSCLTVTGHCCHKHFYDTRHLPCLKVWSRMTLSNRECPLSPSRVLMSRSFRLNQRAHSWESWLLQWEELQASKAVQSLAWGPHNRRRRLDSTCLQDKLANSMIMRRTGNQKDHSGLKSFWTRWQQWRGLLGKEGSEIGDHSEGGVSIKQWCSCIGYQTQRSEGGQGVEVAQWRIQRVQLLVVQCRCRGYVGWSGTLWRQLHLVQGVYVHWRKDLIQTTEGLSSGEWDGIIIQVNFIVLGEDTICFSSIK